MKRRKLTRTDINFWLDVLLLTLFLNVIWSSVVVQFVFPPGTLAKGWTLWTWDYDAWCEFQFAAICAFALAVLVHVMLHWSWVCGVVASRLGTKKSAAALSEGSRTLWGVGLLITVVNLVGITIAVAALTIQGPGY